MKLFYLIVAQLILNSSVYSQGDFSEDQLWNSTKEISANETFIRPRHNYKRYRWGTDAIGTIGASAGSETFFGLKGSVQGRLTYSQITARSQRELHLFGIHGGLELSAFGLFAAWGSAGVNVGISIGPITLDGSLTFWGAGLNDTYFGTTTYNPKIGLQILDCVWLKTGYCYFLRGENWFPEWMVVNGQRLNIEVSYVMVL